MLTTLRDRSRHYNLPAALIALLVLALAFLLGQRASPLWLGLLVAGMGAALLLQEPRLGLLAKALLALAYAPRAAIISAASLVRSDQQPRAHTYQRLLAELPAM